MRSKTIYLLILLLILTSSKFIASYEIGQFGFIKNENTHPLTNPEVLLRQSIFDPSQRLGSKMFFDNFENGTSTWTSGGKGEYNTGSYGHGNSTIELGPPSFSPNRALRMRTTNSGGGASSDWHAQTNNVRYGVGTPSNNPEFIVNFKVLFPNRIGFNPTSGEWSFFSLAQFKGVGSAGNHTLHALTIESKDGEGGPMYFKSTYFGGQWGTPPNQSFEPIQGRVNAIEIPTNKWVDITIRYKFSDGDGIWQVWQDGVMIFDLRKQRTWRNGQMDWAYSGLNNYGRFHRGYTNQKSWDGKNHVDVFIDDYGFYNLNPEWDYDLDLPKNGSPVPTQPYQLKLNPIPAEGGKIKIITNN